MNRRILQAAVCGALAMHALAAAPRHLQLEAPAHDDVRRFIAPIKNLSLDGDTPTTWETITRTGRFYDPRYGEFEITQPMLLQMVENFEKNTYGQELLFDVSHEPSKGAACKVLKLQVQDGKLRALLEWTPYGADAVKNRGFRYFSAEYHEDWQDNEKRARHGATLLGAGLTIRPVIKGLDPVEPSRIALAQPDGAPPTLLHPELSTQFLSEIQTMWKELILRLQASLAGFKLAAPVVSQLVSVAEKSLANVTDKTAAEALIGALEASGKQLAEQIGDKAVTITLAAPSAAGMSADEVKKLMADTLQAQAEATRKLAETHSARVKVLTDTINAASGLDESIRKELAEAGTALVTGEMSEEQVKALAAYQVSEANKRVAAMKLSAIGFMHTPTGSVHIEVTDEGAKKLSGLYHEQLKKTASHASGRLRLAEKTLPFVAMVLAQFDQLHAAQMHEEVKRLAAGSTGMVDVSLPVGFQREVIREALSDLRVLELVQTLTDFAATVTTQIPYEQRDVSAVYNNGVVYEGQPIHRASISQAMDTAYIQPMKLAMLISNEVAHFSRSSGLNWDAMARNIESNARFMRELICRRIANELQRSADAYGAEAVTGETFDTQLTGSNSVIKTTYYPIVRPHQQRDLRGQAVGSEENPIAIVLNGVTLEAYDGTGTQSSGTYYQVTNYNLGYIKLVNQLGVAVTPADSGTNTIGYSKATNVVTFDLDVDVDLTPEKHLNGLLRKISAQKAMLSQDRYVQPDFLLMSATLNDTCSNAEQFELSHGRDGSGTTAQGDLATVKGVPAWGTNAPGIDLGDERILIGQRGLCGYSVAKPFETGTPFEAVDSTGKPIGKKQAYGEEYSAIKVPTPVRNRMTSVIAYSFSGR